MQNASKRAAGGGIAAGKRQGEWTSQGVRRTIFSGSQTGTPPVIRGARAVGHGKMSGRRRIAASIRVVPQRFWPLSQKKF